MLYQDWYKFVEKKNILFTKLTVKGDKECLSQPTPNWRLKYTI